MIFGLLLDPKWNWWCFIHGTNPATRKRSVLVTSLLTRWQRTCPVFGNPFGSRVLTVNKPNSHESERREEWQSLDTVIDIPLHCLVDSLDDAGSGIVLLHFLEEQRRGCLEITAKTISHTPCHGNSKNRLPLFVAVCIVHEKREPSGPYF